MDSFKKDEDKEARKREASKSRAKQFKSQKSVQKAQDFDYTTDGNKTASLKESKYLIQNKGMDKGQVFGDLKKRAESGDIKLSNRMEDNIARYDQRQEDRADRKAARSAAREKAKAVAKKPAIPPKTDGDFKVRKPAIPSSTTGDFKVGGDLNQNVGKTGDMTTTISDSTFGAGASVGNDYSVTIGSNRAGNSSGSGSADDGSTTSLSNMQSAAAYNALNSNSLARSRSEMSGYGRAAGAIEEAKKANSTPNADRIAAYNFAGANQNYLQDKVDQIRSQYMGSLAGYQAPTFEMPTAPRPVDLDPAKDIYEDAKDELDM